MRVQCSFEEFEKRENVMAQALHIPSQKQRSVRSPLTSITVLALWRVRKTWGMLSLVGLGMIATVVLVCTLPLYAHVTTTAGLRQTLTSGNDSDYITMQMNLKGISSKLLADLSSTLDTYPTRNPSSFIQQEPQQYLSSENYPISALQTGAKATPTVPDNPRDTFSLSGYTLASAAPHLQMIAGRLPSEQSQDVEVAITSKTAQDLHLQVGSSVKITLNGTFYLLNNVGTGGTSTTQTQLLHIVGIYRPNATNDPFWHGQDQDPVITPPPAGVAAQAPLINAKALISDSRLLNIYDTLIKRQSSKQQGILPILFEDYASNNSILSATWYFHLDTQQLDIQQMDNLQATLDGWQDDLNNKFGNSLEGRGWGAYDYPYIVSGGMHGATLGDNSVLRTYQKQLEIVNIPTFLLLAEIVALALFFISLMSDLLIERQADAIAVLRSRGATTSQLFCAFITQGLMLSVLALLAGPLLAYLFTGTLAHQVLTPQQQQALNTINAHPLDTLLSLRIYALLAVAVAFITMVFAIYRAIRVDILMLRREKARTTRRPLWQRLHLDLFAIVLALFGYGVALYISHIGGSDLRTQAIVAAPMAIIGPTFLTIAGMLILMRLFPRALQWGARVAAQGRGAPALLALGQMARSPRQSLRLTLLLSLASAFAIFVLVFNAAQTQRIYDVANYEVGADFSGFQLYYGNPDPNTTEKAILTIDGVQAASSGLATNATVALAGNHNTPSVQIELRAVHAETFAQAAIWTQQNSDQPLSSLMQTLIVQRPTAIAQQVVPAFVDESTWNQLGLQPGTRFTLHDNTINSLDSSKLTFIALDKIHLLPTTDHTIDPVNNTLTFPAGVLVDYQTYTTIYNQQFHNQLPVNYHWVHTKNATVQATVRTRLTNGQIAVTINTLYDRGQIIDQMQQNPLYLTLTGELLSGMGIALLLALLGSLLISWLGTRTRLTNFAMLRALGSSPNQVIGMLTWEQCVTYITALLLGMLFGALIAITVVPSLVFSSVPITQGTTSGSFYLIQQLLPVRLQVPVSLLLFLVVLIFICLVTLGMMIRVIAKPSLSQALRLNED